VFLVDLNRERLDVAAALVAPDEAICGGETDVVEAVTKLTDGRGADVVITAAASGQAQEQAVAIAARQGRISFFGGLPKDNPVISLDSNLVHHRELTVVGANGCASSSRTSYSCSRYPEPCARSRSCIARSGSCIDVCCPSSGAVVGTSGAGRCP